MSDIHRDAIIETVKKSINKIFEALEKLDSETVLAHYHNHPDFRFSGLIFGQVMNLTYEEFTTAMKGAYETMVEQKMIRESQV